MKENWIVTFSGQGLYILVCNFANLNRIAHYRYSAELYSTKERNSGSEVIGRWKPKTIKQ